MPAFRQNMLLQTREAEEREKALEALQGQEISLCQKANKEKEFREMLYLWKERTLCKAVQVKEKTPN